MNNELYIKSQRRYGLHSPLRYPGGKASLAGLFADLIGDMGLSKATYVEPYAGGVGAGLALLNEGLINKLVINDIDPAVYAFWNSVTSENGAFVRKVRRAELTISEWRRQREIYRKADISDPLKLGFAFFYLNRTNRSGILNGGVIGGLEQKGNYLIDARFNKETLIERLERIGKASNRIEVTFLDGRSVVEKYGDDKSAFFYVDPPYVKAGSRLYLNSFDGRDHLALSELLNDSLNMNWLLTYDDSPFIEKIYRENFQCRLHLNYSARHPGKAQELLVASPTVAAAIESHLHSSVQVLIGT
ncbi:MAG: DNA adenine methylase [Candidatus Nanopelagicales bacterium]